MNLRKSLCSFSLVFCAVFGVRIASFAVEKTAEKKTEKKVTKTDKTEAVPMKEIEPLVPGPPLPPSFPMPLPMDGTPPPLDVAATPGAEAIPAQRWFGAFNYVLRTDLADTLTPRLYTHQVSITAGYLTGSQLSIYGSLLGNYDSTGERDSEVIVDRNDVQGFLNDFTLGLSKELMLNPRWTLEAGAENTFPTSPAAQTEGYGSITSVSATLASSAFDKRLRYYSSASSYYIWNKYRTSPATLATNPSFGFNLRVGASWSFAKYFFIGVEGGAQNTQYVDGTGDLAYRNSISVGGRYEKWSLRATLVNGSYLDREEASFFFIDEYRRTMSVNLGYTF